MNVSRSADPVSKRWGWATRMFWLALAAVRVGGLFFDGGGWGDPPVAVVAQVAGRTPAAKA